jgi:ATP-binding cassette subfamily B multidrug efflux pump
MFSRLFHYFETLVDPYTAYPDKDTPPRRLFAFMWDYSQPFKALFAATALMSLVVATIEIGLIWYMGRVVDLLSNGTPAEVLADHGTELILAALFVLLIRPLMQGIDVALLNNAILPQFGTLIRWRAHRQVLRQSVGFFENDFAGRIANRIMQTPLSGGEAVFQIFDAITFALAYLVGAADPALRGRSAPASAACGLVRALRASPALDDPAHRPGVQGQRRCALRHHGADRGQLHQHPCGEALRPSRPGNRLREGGDRNHAADLRAEMRLFTIMDVALTVLNGLLIVAVVGWAVWLWAGGAATVGTVAAATALTLRLNAMTGWIMWAVSSSSALGVVAEGMETITEPITLTDAPDAQAARFRQGRDRVRRGLAPLRARRGRAGPAQPDDPARREGRPDRTLRRGKIDLVKLLLRFYDVEGGRILIDGQDIADVTQDSLRHKIGMVQQDSALLHRSVGTTSFTAGPTRRRRR